MAIVTKKRRVEIIAFERKRVVLQPVPMFCPVCHLSSEMLTVPQAGALAQVKAESVRRWLAQGKAHGVKTPGGHYRICKNSLFHSAANPESLMYMNREDHD
jgi:hypothetical protein